MKNLVIIAGKGDLAKQLVEFTQDKYNCLIFAIQGETDQEYVKNFNHVWINLGEIGKAIELMKRFNAEFVVFAGSVHKPDLLSLKVDAAGAKLLAKIIKNKFFGDNNLLSNLTNFLEEYGFKVLGVHEILKSLVVEDAIFTKLTPDNQDKLDIELGIKAVQALGLLDIGQCVIVDNAVVLGVEAVEGTDQLINRCKQLKKSDTQSGVLVKFAKPGQELRIDLPTIGFSTIQNMRDAGFKGIVIEANKTIFLDKDKVIEFANQNNMFVCSKML